MPTKTVEKNIEYVVKHRNNLKASMCDDKYKKIEAEVRQLRQLRAKAIANSNTTNAKVLDTQTGAKMINDLVNFVLSGIPQTTTGRPRK